MWSTIRELVAEGTTVLLTTQNLDEADRLATDIAVIDHGRLLAEGTSDELKDRVGGQRIEITLDDASPAEVAVRALASMADEGAIVAGDLVTGVEGRVAGRNTLDPSARVNAAGATVSSGGVSRSDAASAASAISSTSVSRSVRRHHSGLHSLARVTTTKCRGVFCASGGHPGTGITQTSPKRSAPILRLYTEHHSIAG